MQASPPAREVSPAGDAELPRQARLPDGAGPIGPGTPPRRRPIPPKFYRVGELAEYSGLSRQTMHNYTTMGLLRETKWTGGGHRLYDESAFARLDAVAEFKSQRRSLEYIRRYFAHLGD